MTDRRPPDTPPEGMTPEEHDEFHSSLEIDDSSGWRVLIVPALLLLLVIGMVAFFFIAESETEPDPRIADRLNNNEAAETQPVQPAPVPAIQPEAMTPADQEAPPAEANETAPPAR